MKHPTHFDGEPDRFARMRALFPKRSTVSVKFADPDPKRFRWSRLQAMAQRAIWKVRRAA